MRGSSVILLLAATLVLSACASSPAPSEKPPATDAEGERSEPADTPQASSAAAAESVPALLRNTGPRNGVPVFAGFASRLRDRDEEESKAVDDAAYEALRYLEVKGSVVLIAQESGRELGYAQAVETRVEDARFEEVREGLEVVDAVQDRHGTAVLVSAPDLPRVQAQPVSSPGSGRPQWIDQVPEIAGHHVGMGIAERRRSRNDSIEAADEQALAEIILERTARLRAVGDARSVEGHGTAERTTRAEEAADVVNGFYVLSRWRSEDGRYYYSLAVARRD
jgi:hypothetical protein